MDYLYYSKDMHKYNTRNKNDIHVTHVNNMTYGSRKLGYRGRNFWNNLPTVLKQETSTNTFKDKLTLYFMIPRTGSSNQWTEDRTTLDLSFLISPDVSTNSIVKVFIKRRRY